MIRTLNGEIAVEELRIGDSVCTYDWENRKEVTRRVSWVGNKQTITNSSLPDDQAGYPVRIAKDAIATGVPYKDLLVTAEHCLFFDGKFVPVRLLVNGSSISYNHSITDYTYYHIETTEYSVIWANGMLTESYLNTGNRVGFKQHGDLVLFVNQYARPKNWVSDASAPLVVDRSIIELKYVANGTKKITNEPDLQLLTQSGIVIKPHATQKNRYIFKLPEHAQTVYLKSRSNRPCDTVGSFVDDRRKLGVLVGSIKMLTSNELRPLTEHLVSTKLEGREVIEQPHCRWTRGLAELNVAENMNILHRILVVEILAGRPYLIQDEDPIDF